MTLDEFAQLIPGLGGMSHVDKIRHFAWFLLAHEKRERFSTADIRRCYEGLHCATPANLSSQLQQMAEKRPPDLLKDSRGLRLENRVKERLDAKYAQRQQTAVVDAMLQSLPGKITDDAERLFLSEA